MGLASRLSRTLLAEHGIDRWYDVAVDDRKAVAEVVRQERIVAGLVVLEGPAAMALEGAEVPTVFVDSLPFLWTEGDRAALPMDVSVYCAQRCVDLPAECRGVPPRSAICGGWRRWSRRPPRRPHRPRPSRCRCGGRW